MNYKNQIREKYNALVFFKMTTYILCKKNSKNRKLYENMYSNIKLSNFTLITMIHVFIVDNGNRMS